ncbi:MAG TPA: extracellular solute-binding protein [Pirellulales bacterium]|nr:extracellular solute-binding protein [Pirellulales bacterium]
MKLALTALFVAALALPAIAGCDASAARDEVIVYVAVDRGDAEPILRRFEEQSGVRVRAVYDAEAAKTTGLVTRLLAESDHPRCDVFWNNELVQTLLLAQRGALDAYRPASADDLPDDFKAADGRWTAVAQRARVIVYNAEHVPADQAPQSIFDLTKPEWRGKAAIANPQFGATRAHVAALFAVLGEERAKKWLSDLRANDIRIVDGNAMVKNLVGKATPGASPIYVGLTDTDDVESGLAEGRPLAMVYPDQDELGTLLMPSTVALVRGAPHPEAARKLIDYLTSRDVGTALTAGNSGYLPVREGAVAAKLKLPPRRMQVPLDKWFDELEPSSLWTQEHFQP